MSVSSGKPELQPGPPLEPAGSRSQSSNGTGGGCLPFLSSMNQSRDSRNSIRQRRQQLSAEYRMAAALGACKQLVSLRRFLGAKRIALYLAADGELDPLPVLEQACAMGKQCYLPVLHPLGYKRLCFAAWRPGDALRPNRYNIAEPEWTPSALIKPWALDLVVVPLVAFDAAANRLGMGGGYYDRSFAWRRNRRYWNGPSLVGYGYELQKLSCISPRPWDIKMDLIVTENTLYMG